MFWCCFTLHLRRRSRKFLKLGVRYEVAVIYERLEANALPCKYQRRA